MFGAVIDATKVANPLSPIVNELDERVDIGTALSAAYDRLVIE